MRNLTFPEVPWKNGSSRTLMALPGDLEGLHTKEKTLFGNIDNYINHGLLNFDT